MDSRITKYIIVGIIIAVLFMGASLIWGIYQKNSGSKERLATITSKEVTAQEVAKHSSPNDCWVILGGVVYSGTSTIKDNPDKKALLSSVCGKDGTKVYSVLKYQEQELSDQDIIKLGDHLTANKIGILAP